MPQGHVPSPAAYLNGDGVISSEEREFWRNDAGDGEDGANPSRCRHCKRGVTLHISHCLGSREPSAVSIQPEADR
jgi:hypothetical protein